MSEDLKMSDYYIVSSEDISDYDHVAEITKTHWLSDENHPCCMTPTCRKNFTFFDRQHHCRMCGQIFCRQCVNFRKRLNKIAHPDPQGDSYKVCKVCFEVGKDDRVTTRDLKKDFQMLKRIAKQETMNSVERQSSFLKTRRDKIDLEWECDRLRNGFLKSFGRSEMRRSLHEVKTAIATPDWQKSSVWLQESMADKCQGCSHGFGLLKKKYWCKVCGQCRCKACCRQELLVYIPDEVKDKGEMVAKLVIIKVIGSPEVEPEVSLLLHVCNKCQDYISTRQISQVEKKQQEQDQADTDIVEKLQRLDKGISEVQNKISDQLTKWIDELNAIKGASIKFHDVVESLDGPSSTQSTGNHSNTKLIAKAQIDIADNFASLDRKIQVVKALIGASQTPTQEKLCKNYLKSKCQFYLNNKTTYSQVKFKLTSGEFLTPEVLNSIQKFVDEKSIVSAQVYIRQLVFETLSMCHKHSLHDLVPKLLTDLDTVIEEEACQCLTMAGEDWELHEKSVKDIVQSQMKDRRLIRLSTRQLAADQHKHAADIMLKRTDSILQQVMVQLDIKTLIRSFTRTKQQLEKASDAINNLHVQDLLKT